MLFQTLRHVRLCIRICLSNTEPIGQKGYGRVFLLILLSSSIPPLYLYRMVRHRKIAFPCLFSMLCVILVMTPLAQRFQVIIRAVFWCMVEVGNRQHNICVLTCLRVMAVSVIFNTAELATVICSFQNPFSYLLPTLWIARLVFWLNGHYLPPSSLPPSSLSKSVFPLCVIRSNLPYLHGIKAKMEFYYHK